MGRKEEISSFVYRKILYITAVSDTGEGKAILSKLRRGIGHAPGEIPELLGVILTDMPEKFMAKGDNTEPTKEEWACYAALTLFAMHQQGNDLKKDPVNVSEDVSMGRAMSEYVSFSGDSNARERMAVKLQTLASAKDIKELNYYLKSVIQLLKTKGISLNYPQLAKDIYECQFEDSRFHVFLRWGQDFYRNAKYDIEKAKEKENE